MNHVLVTGPAQGSAPSLVAVAIARSLSLHGFRVAPLYLGSPDTQTFPCPEGGTVSRPAAVLSEACGLLPQARFEGSAVDTFGQEFDWLVIDAPAGLASTPNHCRELTIEPQGDGWLVTTGATTLLLPPAPPVELTPRISPEVEALPEYRPGLPRIGVLSCPHIANFDDFLHVPGAEWIAFPLPGKLDVILIPASSDHASDTEWLGLQGLDNWLTLQKAMGCRMVSAGFPITGVKPSLAPGDLRDLNTLSLAIGARVAPPLPSDGDINRLAEWWEAGFGAHPEQLAP